MAKKKQDEPAPAPMPVNVNAQFPPGEIAVLDLLVAKDKSSRSAVVRKAVALLAGQSGISR